MNRREESRSTEILPLTNPDVRSTSKILIKKATTSTSPSAQMCFSLQNLSVTYYLERGRNDNEPALEQLFDKLVKKALTHVK